MTRECHVRFCERLGVKLPGATLPTMLSSRLIKMEHDALFGLASQ